jgi:hypothetical protein
MTRRCAAATAVRGCVAPVHRPPTANAPLPAPVRRPAQPDPVDEAERPFDESDFSMAPPPSGCMFNVPPRRFPT